jgi:hypothetical protein
MMKLSDLVSKMNLQVVVAQFNLAVDVTGGYASDLLSDVLANSAAGDVWVTLQAHQNIVAVASMKGIVGIILVSGRKPQEDTLQKAAEEGIPIMVTDLPAFELIGALYGMGIRGRAPKSPPPGGAS